MTNDIPVDKNYSFDYFIRHGDRDLADKMCDLISFYIIMWIMTNIKLMNECLF